MLVACRLAGLSALETYYAGVRVGAQFGAACGCAPSLNDSSSLALKIRRLARNSRPGDDGAVTSLGNSYRRVRLSGPPN
jgi:hypothetical protein